MILNEVFTTKFPPKEILSTYLTLTFLALFHIYNLRGRCFPTTEALASVFTNISTSSTARCNLTFKREMCYGV